MVSSYYIYDRTGAGRVWNLKQTPIHCWLEYKETGEVFDITYDQFDDPFPYNMGTNLLSIKRDRFINASKNPRISTKNDVTDSANINDELFMQQLMEKAAILGKAAGLE